MKAIGLFAIVAGLWLLIPQESLAQDGTIAVPEPGSLSLLASGVAATMYAFWRTRK
jgi:hypothetical protein